MTTVTTEQTPNPLAFTTGQQHLTPDQLLMLQVNWEKARRNPWEFLTRFVYTHQQHGAEAHIQLFPNDRPHLYACTQLWLGNRMTAWVKSRQMIMTWLFVSLAVWDFLMHPGRLIILQSKKLEDAVGDQTAGDGLLGRAKFIINHIPGRELLLPRDMIPPLGSKPSDAVRVRMPSTGSALWAIAQGGEQIRQKTISGLLSDEAAFQEEFEDAYTASIPTMRASGDEAKDNDPATRAWFVALSTAHPGFHDKLVNDQVGED